MIATLRPVIPTFILVFLQLAACSAGGDGDAPGGEEMADRYAVVSTNGFLAVPPPACTEGEWVDHGCDGRTSLACASSGLRIGMDDTDSCPVCVEPSPEDPTTCEGWQIAYGEFLAAQISASCANFCDDEEIGCSALEITNACGTFALPLTAGIDEEVVIFAEIFARENCGLCGEVEQTATGLTETFGEYLQACYQHQCVLEKRTDLPDQDAAP
jgi:hypothetical protein